MRSAAKRIWYISMFIVGTATIGRNRDDTTVLKSNQLYKDYSIFVRTYETRCYRRRSSPFRPVDIVTCQLLRSHQGDNAIGTRVMAGFPRSEPHNTRLVKKKKATIPICKRAALLCEVFQHYTAACIWLEPHYFPSENGCSPSSPLRWYSIILQRGSYSVKIRKEGGVTRCIRT